MILTINDNDSATPHGVEPDARGQAALLLAESILHALVEKKLLTSAEAVAVVQTTIEVKAEVAASAGESKARMDESLALLSAISRSFGTDAR